MTLWLMTPRVRPRSTMPNWLWTTPATDEAPDG